MEKKDKFIVCGMGGSALAAGLLRVYDPKLDLLIHHDYGLPRVPDYFLRESLIILSSYSGNTEEVLDVAEQAHSQGLNLAVITAGGELLNWAKEKNVKCIELAEKSLQPRLALHPQALALCQLTGVTPPGNITQPTAVPLDLGGKIPVIYASSVNWPLAYVWKAAFNETAKLPAFASVLPEANHNELESLTANFHAIFLTDGADHERVQKRCTLTTQIYRERGLGVTTIDISKSDRWDKIFSCIALADQTTQFLARARGVDPFSVPVIEDFKTRLKR